VTGDRSGRERSGSDRRPRWGRGCWSRPETADRGRRWCDAGLRAGRGGTLIEAAQHGDSGADPLADAFTPEVDRRQAIREHGEADHKDSSEVRTGDRRPVAPACPSLAKPPAFASTHARSSPRLRPAPRTRPA